MSELAKWIQENLVVTSWGEYDGIKEPNLAQLGALQMLVQQAIQKELAK
jgi:hypothetical protein